MRRIIPLFLSVLFFSNLFAIQKITNSKTNIEEPVIELVSSTIDKSVVKLTFGSFDLDEVKTKRGNASILKVEGATPLLISEAPDLLKFTSSIIIPDKSEMGVKVIFSKYQDFENVEIAPSKGDFTRDIDPASMPYIYGQQYNENEFFPGNVADLRDPFVLRDYRASTIVFYPFQYNPVTKLLRVYYEIVVEVEEIAENGKNQLLSENEKKPSSYEHTNIYQNLFLNYNSVKYTPVSENGNMLIISYGQYISAMQAFVDWKISAGRNVEIVDVATIGTASAIKTYVANYYNTNGLTYLLLVGDAAQVPTYSASSGDSDNSYGYISGNDSYPEVFVGRFSAESAQDVNTQVARTLDYEKNPTAGNWLTNGIGIASSQGPGDDNEYDYQHILNMKSDLISYTYNSCAEMFDGSQGGLDASGNPSPTMVSNEINSGSGIILYTGHGSTTSFSSSGFSNSNINSLTNTGMLPFIWSVACVNGDFVNSTCFAETWLRATHNDEPSGAIATLMSTINQSWNPPMCGQDEMVDILTESYTNNIKRTFGGLSMNGCMQMNDEYGSGGANMTDTWTCFGDPSLMVRTANPLQMLVTHNQTVNIGATSFQVNCSVEDALVSLTLNSQIIGTGIVANGVANISLSALSSIDTVDIVVTAFNYIPYINEVAIISMTGPYLSISSFSINDPLGNNNGEAEFGESISLNTTLENIGVSNANGVSVSITSVDTFVTITDANEAFGNIAAGVNSTQNNAFGLDIANNAPDQHQVFIGATITDNNSNTWNSSMAVLINAPELTVGTVTVDDANGNGNGLIDPGETVTISIENINSGHATATNVNGFLSTANSDITINIQNYPIGNLAEGANSNASFVVSASATMPQTASIDFDYTITSGLYSWQNPISLIMASYCTPSYTNGCSAGDEIDDFILNTINHMNSGCSTGGYGDFTSMSTDLAQDSMYVLQISTNYSNQKLTIWIDFNDDASFDASEQVVTNFSLGTASTLYSTFATIPANANPGSHRMRARISWSTLCSDPCDNYQYGEAHDYMVNILPDLSTPVVVLGPDINICDGNVANINANVQNGTPPFSYNWSTGGNSSSISVSPSTQTTYSLTVTDAAGEIAIDDIVVSVSALPVVNLGADINLPTGQTATIDAGFGFISYLWNDGSTQQTLTVSSTGTYSVTVVNTDACTATDNINVFIETLPSPTWSYNITGTNHSILVPVSANINIDGMPISYGDYIGVFYDSLGTLACGGFIMWEEITNSLTAWGADFSNDGFQTGEEFKWKIWDASESMEYSAMAVYNTSGFPNEGLFQPNGISGLQALNVSLSETQSIDIFEGWNIFSTYIEPTNSMMSDIMSAILQNVTIVKNSIGQVYWPLYSINSIGVLNVEEGYQIKVTTNSILEIEGTAVQPENYPITMNTGWQIISYLRQSAASIATMMSDVVNNLEIVKNELGFVYWPQYGVNGIGNMVPGEGYLLKMFNADTLLYAPNTASFSKSNIIQNEKYFYKNVKNTGSNMTLGIPKTSWETEPLIGSEIGIFCSDSNVGEKLIGSSVYVGENLAIAIWGNDEHTAENDGLNEGEKFVLRIWSNEVETYLEIKNWLEGNEFYKTNKISIAKKLSITNSQLSIPELCQNTPNPFNKISEISFNIPNATFVEIETYNLVGELCEVLISKKLNAGIHKIEVDATKYQSGSYFYRIRTNDFFDAKRFSVVK